MMKAIIFFEKVGIFLLLKYRLNNTSKIDGEDIHDDS